MYSHLFLFGHFSPYTDEVGALVFDMGSYSVRAGYAGEDCPKVWTVKWIHILVVKLKNICSEQKCNCFLVFRLIFLLWSVWLWTGRMAVHQWRQMERRESRAAPPTTSTLTSSGSLEKTWRSCHLSKMGWVSWRKRVWICFFLNFFFSLFP